MIAKYFITDCEHEGDIAWACDEVRDAGGRVLTTEWDGEDCGEAYVYCEIDDKKFKKLSARNADWSSAEYMKNSFKSRGLI